MTAARFYSSVAGQMVLQADITAVATTLTVDTTTGLPGTVPFTLVIDPALATEEILDVTNVSGLTLTVTRGVDGSSAQTHTAGAKLRHMATARDFRDAQEHIGATTGVHGVGAGIAVVGTDTVQTLTNKTAQAATAATKALVVKGAASQTASYLEVQDSTGSALLKVIPGQDTLTLGNLRVNGAGADNLFGYLVKAISSSATVVAGIFKRASGQTADILQIQSDTGSVLAKFDSAGKLTTPQVISQGDVSGTTGTFSGAITSPTITTIQNNDTTMSGQISGIDTRVQALETSTYTSVTLSGGFTGTLEYRQRGKTVDIRGNITAGTFNAGFTAICAAGAIPTAARPGVTPARGNAYVGSGTEMGTVEVTTAGTVNVQVSNAHTLAAFNFSYPAA